MYYIFGSFFQASNKHILEEHALRKGRGWAIISLHQLQLEVLPTIFSQPNHGEVRNCEREWRWVTFTPVDRGHSQFGRDQAIQMYGNFEGFPLSYCSVWVGRIMTPGWSPLEMYTIFTILIVSGICLWKSFWNSLPLLLFQSLQKKTCLVELCLTWYY